jgi:formate/nitrite transporter FocA (FNT family)
MSVFAGETALLDYLGGFLVPATLGNSLGGFFLVAILNYGQVIGSRKRPMLRMNRKNWEE